MPQDSRRRRRFRRGKRPGSGSASSARPQLPPEAECADCRKPLSLCVCSEIRELASRHHVVILQHPQEPDKELGSAWLAHRSLPNSTLRVGLSWPNLKKALGREDAVPSQWAVLYLGSGIQGKAPEASGRTDVPAKRSRLVLVDKTGKPLPDSDSALRELRGIVVLDGTWSQAKTLWWRNAWLLKLKRAVLIPGQPSQYRELRREPRRECLSTIESIAASLEALGEDPSVSSGLNSLFGKLLDRQRARLKAARPEVAAKPAAEAPDSN